MALIPIQDLLKSELNHLTRGTPLAHVVTHGRAQKYTNESLGNWFKNRCKEAGLAHFSLHGVRKGVATAMADEGKTEHQIMAFLAHSSPKEAATYTKNANRARLIEEGLSNQVEGLDRGAPQPSEQKGKI